MTKEQRKQCEKIINLYRKIDILDHKENNIGFGAARRPVISVKVYPYICSIENSDIYKFKAMAISLSKIFNKEFFPSCIKRYEEITGQFWEFLFEAVRRHKEYKSYISDIPEGFLDINSYEDKDGFLIKGIGWAIANYFDIKEKEEIMKRRDTAWKYVRKPFREIRRDIKNRLIRKNKLIKINNAIENTDCEGD